MASEPRSASTDRPQNHEPKPAEKPQAANPQTADEPQEAMITWLGEPGGEDDAVNTWNGYTFEKGKAVKVNNPRMIADAKTNRQYKVA